MIRGSLRPAGRRAKGLQHERGQVSERLKEHAWKVCKRLNPASRVRIPPCPPSSTALSRLVVGEAHSPARESARRTVPDGLALAGEPPSRNVAIATHRRAPALQPQTAVLLHIVTVPVFVSSGPEASTRFASAARRTRVVAPSRSKSCSTAMRSPFGSRRAGAGRAERSSSARTRFLASDDEIDDWPAQGHGQRCGPSEADHEVGAPAGDPKPAREPGADLRHLDWHVEVRMANA